MNPRLKYYLISHPHPDEAKTESVFNWAEAKPDAQLMELEAGNRLRLSASF